MTPPKKDKAKVPTDEEILDEWCFPGDRPFNNVLVHESSLLGLIKQARHAGRREGAAGRNKTEDDMEERLTDAQLLRKIGKSLGVTYRDSRRWIKEEVPPLAWGHEDVLEIVRRVRLAGQEEEKQRIEDSGYRIKIWEDGYRQGAEKQREKDIAIAQEIERKYENNLAVKVYIEVTKTDENSTEFLICSYCGSVGKEQKPT